MIELIRRELDAIYAICSFEGVQKRSGRSRSELASTLSADLSAYLMCLLKTGVKYTEDDIEPAYTLVKEYLAGYGISIPQKLSGQPNEKLLGRCLLSGGREAPVPSIMKAWEPADKAVIGDNGNLSGTPSGLLYRAFMYTGANFLSLYNHSEAGEQSRQAYLANMRHYLSRLLNRDFRFSVQDDYRAKENRFYQGFDGVPGSQNRTDTSGPMEQLNALIGLDSIKQDVVELSSFVSLQELRREAGLKSVPVTLHLVFTGNPGTGKTTVARILAKIYKKNGVLSKGQLVEVDRADLVAGYIGQTAIKTQKKIEEALGGILFIDEAYTLAKEGNDFGQEAIDTLLKAMEDHRDDFIVIVAGYTDLMKTFINSNPGLKSRFNKFIEFPDYTADELFRIFCSMCASYDYELDEEAKGVVRMNLEKMVAEKAPNFANARAVRNLFEAIITNQAARVIASGETSPEALMRVTVGDTEEVFR